MINIGKGTLTYFARAVSDTVAVFDYGATGEKHLTVPGNTGSLTQSGNANAPTVARISTTVTIYVLTNGQTAAVPAADSTSFPSPNTVPTQFTAGSDYWIMVNPGVLLSIAASGAGFVTIDFYRDTDLLDFQSSPVTGP